MYSILHKKLHTFTCTIHVVLHCIQPAVFLISVYLKMFLLGKISFKKSAQVLVHWNALLRTGFFFTGNYSTAGLLTVSTDNKPLLIKAVSVPAHVFEGVAEKILLLSWTHKLSST